MGFHDKARMPFSPASHRAGCLLVIGALGLIGCGAPAVPGDPEGVDSPFNIAKAILPGDWGVVGEPVVFTFNSEGVPVAISNTEDPEDWKTNIEFGTPRRIEVPIGALSFIFEPGNPLIDSRTGEARFNAFGTGTDINALGVPVLGTGYATAEFAGFYDQATGELTGTILYEVFYQSLPVYSDSDDYTLVKVE